MVCLFMGPLDCRGRAARLRAEIAAMVEHALASIPGRTSTAGVLSLSWVWVLHLCFAIEFEQSGSSEKAQHVINALEVLK
jgi:hypothetical protein